jgi:ABC-type uncharacterized transport system ATPase component
MAQNTLHDSSTGDVVITPGSSGSSSGGAASSALAAAVASVAALVVPADVARRSARARAAALAQARAEEQARQAAAARAHAEMLAALHRQQVEAHSQAREVRRVQLDAHFAGQAQGLAQALQQEINAARKRPEYDGSERWQLYQITKAQNETKGL